MISNISASPSVPQIGAVRLTTGFLDYWPFRQNYNDNDSGLENIVFWSKPRLRSSVSFSFRYPNGKNTSHNFDIFWKRILTKIVGIEHALLPFFDAKDDALKRTYRTQIKPSNSSRKARFFSDSFPEAQYCMKTRFSMGIVPKGTISHAFVLYSQKMRTSWRVNSWIAVGQWDWQTFALDKKQRVLVPEGFRLCWLQAPTVWERRSKVTTNKRVAIIHRTVRAKRNGASVRTNEPHYKLDLDH